VTKPVVVDLGCGVTFFPFVVAQAGCEVIAVDIDAVVGADFVRAIEVFRDWTRLVTFRPCDRARLPFDDETVDALYCVSVLEHIPDFSATISEIARVLKPKGLLLLTIDVDLSGNSELSPGQYWMLRDALEGILELVEPEVTVHPLRVLDSRNSPYPMTPARTGIRAWLHGVRKEFKAWRHEECAEPYLTCAGLVFEKKARDEAIAT
jgi:SAM-dependent methyltransferase